MPAVLQMLAVHRMLLELVPLPERERLVPVELEALSPEQVHLLVASLLVPVRLQVLHLGKLHLSHLQGFPYL